MSNEKASILKAMDMLPEGVYKEVYKKVVTQLLSENSSNRMKMDEQFIQELVNMVGQNGSRKKNK
ncbi:hypothetical protein [Priestia abyssalis]|uniref:hypothetical protein n=1 Tax=Priestia abyssalis TaxID=1221450 RepID=UPI0009952C26|nr:hypothetical protein [Priestia abyssalis]